VSATEAADHEESSPSALAASSQRRTFTALAIGFAVLSLCVAFTVPLFQIPDENAHWLQGHARVEKLVHPGATCVPTVSLDEWFELEPMRSHPDRKFKTGRIQDLAKHPLACVTPYAEYGNVLTYPGIIASKLLVRDQNTSTVRQVEGIVAARLCQGLIFLLCLLRLGQLGQKAARPGLTVITAFALSPLLAQQAIGVSSDGVGLCFGVVLFGVLLFWEHLRGIDVALFVLSGWGAGAKPFVFPLLLAAPLIGFAFAQLRRSPPPGVRALLADLGRTWVPSRRPSVATMMFWAGAFLTAVTALAALVNVGSVQVGKKGVDGALQFHFLRENPGTLWRLLVDLAPSPWHLDDWAGQLGWLDVNLSPEAIRRFVTLWMGALVFELGLVALRLWRADVVANLRVRRILPAAAVALIGLLVSLAGVLTVIVILYVRWTPVGSPALHGFQIRYLFPVAMFAFGIGFAWLDVVTQPPPGQGDPAWTRTRAGSLVARFVGWAPAALAGAALVPYVATVFLDIVARYY
jgi:hypothetical protein